MNYHMGLNEKLIRGRKAEILVKEKLWRFGYKVKHYGRTVDRFDLLVENKFRVEVKSSIPHFKKNEVYWLIAIPLSHYVDYWDVQAYVFFQTIGVPKILFFTKETILKHFPNSSSITFNSNKKTNYWELGVESPYEIFGRPIINPRARKEKIP